MITSPGEGESENFLKRWKYCAGADLLKRRGPGTFPIYFFQGLLFLHLEIILPFAEWCHAFEGKKLFFCHHSFMTKGHSKLAKNEPENIP